MVSQERVDSQDGNSKFGAAHHFKVAVKLEIGYSFVEGLITVSLIFLLPDCEIPSNYPHPN
jgi:hypothetical protein